MENGADKMVQVRRIYVGGVSAGVTAGDMEKTFSPHGRVISVEFVRSNGRSFAYMDFEPTTDKSLSKIFSTYNGCTWKGGKLKLEMAKEHYLSRLKREWEEDAKLTEIDKLASATPVAEENSDMLRSHGSNQENTQIRIFFPKLRKVKSLPYKGSGKHKYSFQRIEVPSLPINFCDCEEHSKEAETISQKYLSPLSTVVHEKERDIMNNVMNKLIGKDNSETPSDKKMCIAIDSDRLSPREDFQFMKEEEASDSDSGNLVTNIVVVEDGLLMKLKGGMMPSMRQESGFGKQSLSKERSTANVADSRKRKKSGVTNSSSVKPNKTNHPAAADVLSSKFEPPPAKPCNGNSISNSALPLPSHVSPEGLSSPPKIPAEPATTEREREPSDKNAHAAKVQTWVQKHSWKELVGAGNSSFSISTLLSEGPSAPPASKKKSVPEREKSSLKISVKDQITPHNARISEKESRNHSSLLEDQHGEERQKVLESEKESQNHSSLGEDKHGVSQTNNVQEGRPKVPEFSISEVCPFMRNSQSEQQWLKAKAALNGYRKRKNSEDNASRFSKGFGSDKR